jgi:hypothetical protein
MACAHTRTCGAPSLTPARRLLMMMFKNKNDDDDVPEARGERE